MWGGGDGEFGDVGGCQAWPGSFDAADLPAVEVEAVAEEEEYFFEVLVDGADDVFSEEGLSAAMFAEHSSDSLGLVEEAADFVDEVALAAEVDGALAAVFTPGEAVVGAEASAAVGSPGGGDSALGGEAGGVFAEEGEGWVVVWGGVHG